MLCPETIAATATALAISLADGKTAAEVALLSSLFVQVGDTLATIAAAREVLPSCAPRDIE